MADLHVELVAADRNVWSGEATLVVARTASGDIGIMAGPPAAARCAAVRSGDRSATSDGGTVVAAVHGGFISFADNKLSILAEIAELADEIDVDARRAGARAVQGARPTRAPSAAPRSGWLRGGPGAH